MNPPGGDVVVEGSRSPKVGNVVHDALVAIVDRNPLAICPNLIRKVLRQHVLVASEVSAIWMSDKKDVDTP